ncbi:methylmalonyl-CoA mutase subunit beta [Klenkia taihuensis]|uniref:methylmalonyl-CoA mutase n=1 Tax=Klenkia taihuensis TaxID=1225127 RepID=A0A1I1K2V9_9ACTN|nr:methylmalonyl-CoA mutase subunit beta [Klenkia taihuensis]GHE10688.1 methylmalonyl-CoA mutase [Klenkia taihuensis]SFC52323.1 heterodimeric methylmalonyl-CoA mutase small subunit [Klenkia taihuensis]
MSHPAPESEPVAAPDDPPAPDALVLAGEFPPVDRDRWRELVAGVLRKAGREDLPDPVEDALRRTVATGVSVAPLYTAADVADLPDPGAPGLPPFVRGSRVVRPAPSAADGQAATSTPAGWDVRQRHADPDVGTTKDAIGADLENGVTSLWLVLGEGGVPVEALGEVLDGVLLDLAPVTLQGGVAAAEAFLSLVGDRPLAPGGTLGLDPLGDQARTGVPADLSGLGGWARRAAAHGDLRAVVVDATVVHEAGATAVEELACALSSGVAYLRALTGDGLPVEEAARALEFRFAATADQFTTIAMLRAARRLWDRVGEASGVPAADRGMRQHAVTSSVMVTARDPWVNMLRTTVAAFAAGVGGADAITVAPFDAALGLPDPFARRIARNTQSLLLEESHLGRVLDPAGGSWYVESLTDALAHAAWELFTELERAGGYAAALSSGLVAERTAAAWAARSGRLATREDAITGVSEFPNIAEKLPDRRPAPAVASGGGLPRVRAAQVFEDLRDRAEEPADRPAVYLATLGKPAAHTARLTFATNLFQAGGLATPSGDGASGLGGATVACICGSDKDYGGAAALAAELREAGASRIWLAGKPDLAVEGVDGYVFAGCDAVDVLTTTLDELLGARA